MDGWLLGWCVRLLPQKSLKGEKVGVGFINLEIVGTFQKELASNTMNSKLN